MQKVETENKSFLDRGLISFLRLDGEKLAWIVLLAVALLSRAIGLGERPMSHDESLHTVYSWQLFDGRGYQHQPMMHGPLKFILNPVMYFLFGVNDWSARIQVALFGVAMVGFVWLMRRWLGKTGAFLTALMFAISPALLYHGRYIRDEVMLTSLLVLLAVAMFRYLETRSTKWLVWTAVALGLAFLTMEASFIYGGIFGIFLLLALAAQLWQAAWPGDDIANRRGIYRALVVGALPLLAFGLLFVIFKLKIVGFVFLGLGSVLAVAAVVLAILGWGKLLTTFGELDLIVLLFTLVLPFLSAVVLKMLGWQISQFNNPGQVTLEVVWQGGLVLGLLFLVSGALGFLWLRRRWLIAAGVFWALELLFFTTFLTNGQGIGTGLIGSLGYWIDQQEVMRGGQPWYYFYLLIPLYEFLPWVLSIGGTVAWVVGLFRKRQAAEMVEQSDTERGRQSDKGAKKQGGREAADVLLPHGQTPVPVQRVFEAFLVFWPLATWAVFTWVGEKMPWHTVYFAMSMAPLGGWWLGKVLDGIDWRGGWQRGILWLMGMIPLFLIALKAVLPTAAKRPFVDVSVNGLSNTAQWLLALIVALALIYFIYDRVMALGWRQSLRAVAVSLAALLLVFTVGVSYRFNFINYNYPIEPMVYAHATPDIKLVMTQIEEISRRTVGDHALRVAYDNEATWPLEWYFRDYPNKVYFGTTPSRDAMDSPVVIAADPNIVKVKPYLGDRYYEFSYRLIWWPRETYKGLTWQRIRDGLRDPAQRGQFWDVVLHRRYTTKTAQWDPMKRFSVFIRKDIAAQVWDWGAPAAAPGTVPGAVELNPYEAGKRNISALQQLGTVGVASNTAGQFSFPRAVAVDAEGLIYVADSGNHRVQVFNPDGTFLRQWGSLCKLDTGEGCVEGGNGQFNEPWGIAVGQDGSVYVSDTWNHRIQKFTSEGQFVTKWGKFGSTGGELGEGGLLYGPRALAIGHDGNLYVMDTGNKRVQVFTPEGSFIAQWGGGGVIDGSFDEPVGLAQDAAGNWYVADTWNRRVQQFSEAFQFIAQWPVSGWGSQSVVNKPALAVDQTRKLVYAVDPENYRVLAFGLDGSFKATWGQYGMEAESFMLPTGIAVGPDGKVYVVDGDAHRVMIFPPLQ